MHRCSVGYGWFRLDTTGAAASAGCSLTSTRILIEIVVVLVVVVIVGVPFRFDDRLNDGRGLLRLMNLDGSLSRWIFAEQVVVLVEIDLTEQVAVSCRRQRWSRRLSVARWFRFQRSTRRARFGDRPTGWQRRG